MARKRAGKKTHRFGELVIPKDVWVKDSAKVEADIENEPRSDVCPPDMVGRTKKASRCSSK